MNNIFNVKLIGEETDTTPTPTRNNTVVKTNYNGWKLVCDASWDSWKMGIIFPDNEKANYFITNFKQDMLDYRDGMLKEDYIFHVVHFKYPKPDELYADQLNMRKDWVIETY